MTRRQALQRLIANDPSLASSVDAAMLAAINAGADPGAQRTKSEPGAHQASRHRAQAASVGVTLYSERTARNWQAAPVVLLDPHALDCAGSSGDRTLGGQRFDSASSLQWAASRSSSESLGKSTSRELLARLARATQTAPEALGSPERSGNNASEESELEDGEGGLAPRVVLDHRCLAPRDQWVPLSARRACVVCLREFSLLRKRHSCRVCGDVVCGRCSVFPRADLPVAGGKLRACSPCFVAHRKRLESGRARPERSEDRGDGDRSLPSFLSLSTSGSSSSDRDARAGSSAAEELEAARRAAQLEREVEASQRRIRLLEAQVAAQGDRTELLSQAKQAQLLEARGTIQALQEQLRRQEASAREAAHARDSLCLQNLQRQRRTETLRAEKDAEGDALGEEAEGDVQEDEEEASAVAGREDAEDERAALRSRLKVLERQLQQAGISAAEAVPYAEAKRRVAELSARLQALGDDASAGGRGERFALEQQMERFHTALLLSDEYAAEQRRAEQAWEAAQREPNAAAARLLWSGVPVDVARLSERELAARPTPAGGAFPAELARRLKRSNVLRLLREDPRAVAKMHPSVLEALRCSGLALVERRALHHVLQEPARAWRARRQADDSARRKAAWHAKLQEALARAVDAAERHLAASDGRVEGHVCALAGAACPVRADARLRALYGAGLGFPSEPRFLPAEVLQGDPDGAGDKARREAEQVAQASAAVARRRRRELQAHYGPRDVRAVALALGALERADALLDRVRQQDAACSSALAEAAGPESEAAACEALLAAARELARALASRAGVALSGKRRQASAAAADTRSAVELASAAAAVALVQPVLADVDELLSGRRGADAGLRRAAAAVSELLSDVAASNAAARERLGLPEADPAAHREASDRTAWRDRARSDGDRRPEQLSSSVGAAASATVIVGGAGRPSDLLAAIRARKTRPVLKATET